jgi:D-sedoheptulose 7-phosphate isomerase
MTAGNGGSAADAMHIVGELMKGFLLPRKLNGDRRIYSDYLNERLQSGLPAISLVSETAFLSAWANDREAALCYAQQVAALGQSGDVLIGLSTSGNSPNIVYAAEAAKAQGLAVIALTGQSGGKLADLADVLLNVPSEVTHVIQEYHLPVYHAICAAVENEFFGGSL